MNMLRLLLILCFTSGLTFSAFAKDSLSERLVGTWQNLSRTANTWETTFNGDGSYVSVADMRLTTGDNLSEKGKWRLKGNQLFLTPDSHSKPSERPYATVSFDYGRSGGGVVLQLEDESDSQEWDNGDQKVVQTGNYARFYEQNPEDFVCAEEVALMQQEAKAAVIAAQRPSRSIDVKPNPVPVTAVIRGSSVDRINAASGAYLGGIAVNGTPVAVGCDGETIAVLSSNGSIDRWNAQTGEYRGGVAVTGDIESIQVTGGVLIVRTANSISRFDARSGAYKGGGGL